MNDASPPVTRLLRDWNAGNEQVADELFGAVYHELRRQARHAFRRERRDHTLQPTALVHEVYGRLVQQKALRFEDRGDFFAVAARLMRELLIDHARRHGARKRGGGLRRVSVDDHVQACPGPEAELLDLDRALEELAQEFPRQARIIQLRYLADYSIEEVAASLELSPATVKREWKVARARLYRRLNAGAPPTR